MHPARKKLEKEGTDRQRFAIFRVTLAPTDPELTLASPPVLLEERAAVFRVAGTATRRPSVPVPAECTARREFPGLETLS